MNGIHPNLNVAVIYGRVSTQLQLQQGTSLSGQLDTGAGWATAKGLQILEALSDEAVSGKRYWTRPAIQQALTLIEQQKARYFICETVDRAARRAKVAIQIVERVWEAGGIFVANGMEFDDSPNSRFITRMFFGLAEIDYDNTRKRLETGRKRTALGYDPSAPWRQSMQRGNPPYGLRIPTERDVLMGKFPQKLLGRHVIVKGDKEQERRLETVRTLYRMYSEGMRENHLMKWLAEQGIKSPQGRDLWCDGAINYLLKNEVYKGAGFIFKTSGVFDEKREIEKGFNAEYRVPTDKATWEELLPVVLFDPETGEFADAPPIVDPEIWQRVHDKRINDVANLAGRGSLNHYLARFGRCPVCGARWTGMKIRSKYGEWTYYRCRGLYNSAKRDTGCSATVSPYLKAHIAERAFIAVLARVLADPTQIEQAIEAHEQNLYADDSLTLERDKLLHEQKTTRRKLDGARDRFFEAEDEEEKQSCQRLIDQYTTILKEIKPRLETLQRQILPQEFMLPKDRSKKFYAIVSNVYEILTAGPEFEISPEQKAQALEQIVERLDIDKEGRLVVTFTNLSHIPDLEIKIVGDNVRDGSKRKKYTSEQIAAILKVSERVDDIVSYCRDLNIPRPTFYRWKREAEAVPKASTITNEADTYFGMNDFYPYNHVELKRDEPELYALLAKIWGPVP